MTRAIAWFAGPGRCEDVCVVGIFEGLSRAAGGIADITASIASVSVAFRTLREFLRPTGLEPLAFAADAALFIGALFLLVYWALTFALYEPWRRSERAASVAEQLPVRTTRHRAGMWLRAIAIPALLAAFTYLVLAV